jgi:hypothetical protein
MAWRIMTHPDIATLVDPLFACGGKRVGKVDKGQKKKILSPSFQRS